MVKKKKDDGASAKGKKKKETANPEATAHESIVKGSGTISIQKKKRLWRSKAGNY